MKKPLITFAVALVCILIAGPMISRAQRAGMPPADGKQLWDYITQKLPYTKWQAWPGHNDQAHEQKGPHGAYMKIYANNIALEAVAGGKSMPAGAILVKENYGKDKTTLMAVTPMYKVNGYNFEAGDWFWAKYGPDGKVIAAGKPKGCIHCHRVKKDNDWIFTPLK